VTSSSLPSKEVVPAAYVARISAERATRIAELAAVEMESTGSAQGVRLVSAAVVRQVSNIPDQELANRYYNAGFSAFWRRDYETALRNLDLAIAACDQDARIWYYKGFAESALKNDDASVVSFARAVRLHLDQPQQSGQVYQALERIQGPRRVQIQMAMKDAASVQMTPGRVAPSKATIRTHVAQD